ncbi:unnamed protein product, partial [Rotaria sp. Silwood1]
MAANDDTYKNTEILKLILRIEQCRLAIEKEKRKGEEKKRKIEEEKRIQKEFDVIIEEGKRKAEEEKRKQKELDREIELIKTKRTKITQELSSSSMINILTILSDHGAFYNLFVRDHLQSFDISNVLNDNNYLNENTIELIRIYINNVSSMSNANEQQIKSTFQDLILNLLNAFNDCTLLKYLDI